MTGKMMDIGQHYLETVRRDFTNQKHYAERAFSQLEIDDFYVRLGDNTNSIYTIVKHISGNLKSRWTDFLTADGEKPERHRDGEFAEERKSREEILAMWEEGWKCLLGTLAELRPADLSRVVKIRNEPQTVIEATNRAWGHLAGHVAQIMLLARHIKGPEWKWLTIAPGESERFKPGSPPR